MTETALELAQEKRNDQLLDEFIDARLDLLFSAETVGPDARRKLRHLLKYYAKKKHPFRACVRDNMKRFGPGRTEAVCATLKDIIKGTTKWRKGSRSIGMSESLPDFDQETVDLILSIPDEDIEKMLWEAEAYV